MADSQSAEVRYQLNSVPKGEVSVELEAIGGVGNG